MTKVNSLHLDDIMDADENLRSAVEGLRTDTELTKEIAGSSEILKRYIDHFERMSLLIKNYSDFLTEDSDRIYHAALSLLEFDGGMIS